MQTTATDAPAKGRKSTKAPPVVEVRQRRTPTSKGKTRIVAAEPKKVSAKVKEAVQGVADAIAPVPKMRKASKPRAGKTQTMIDMLNRPTGATMDEMKTASGWNEQSLKWFMAGTLAKKGLKVTHEDKGEPAVRTYRIEAPVEAV